MMDDNDSDNTATQNGKQGRQRKKQLYQQILTLLEFYFSDANLTKDRFLSQLIDVDPFIDLTIFLTFNKVKQLTDKVNDIIRAVKKSEILQLNEEKTKVRRTTDIKRIENIDDQTIYVERIPTDFTHDRLTKIFSQFGKVLYISIPKYKHNKVIKGFAFVEFDSVEAAQKTLEHFASIGCKLPSQMPPEKLCSISTFTPPETNSSVQNVQHNKIVESSDTDEPKINTMKAKKIIVPVPPVELETAVKDEESDVLESEKSRKRKIEPLETTEEEHVEKKVKLLDESEHKDTENLNVEGETPEEIITESEGVEKKRRRRKKNGKKSADDIKEMGLQVLSKQEWKRLRNKYLDLQRAKMKNLKSKLCRRRFGNANNYGYNPSNTVETVEVNTTDGKPEKSFNLIPNTVVHMQLPDPCIDVKAFKVELKTFSPDIKYIDVREGHFDAYIRLASSDAAKTFSECEFPATMNILDGEMQESYFKKAEIERQNKFAMSANKAKQRGRDKLLKRAEKELGKHIRFDEAD